MLLTGIFCEDDVWFGYKDAWCTFVFYSVCSLSKQQKQYELGLFSKTKQQ